MDEDEILRNLAGSLEDDVLRQLQAELVRNKPALQEHEYLVLSRDKADGAAQIYVSKEGVMTRLEIAAQLRRLADYVESLTDEQARRP